MNIQYHSVYIQYTCSVQYTVQYMHIYCNRRTVFTVTVFKVVITALCYRIWNIRELKPYGNTYVYICNCTMYIQYTRIQSSKMRHIFFFAPKSKSRIYFFFFTTLYTFTRKPPFVMYHGNTLTSRCKNLCKMVLQDFLHQCLWFSLTFWW